MADGINGQDWKAEVGGIGPEFQDKRPEFYKEKVKNKLGEAFDDVINDLTNKGYTNLNDLKNVSTDLYEHPVVAGDTVFNVLKAWFIEKFPGMNEEQAKKETYLSLAHMLKVSPGINVDFIDVGDKIQIIRGALSVVMPDGNPRFGLTSMRPDMPDGLQPPPSVTPLAPGVGDGLGDRAKEAVQNATAPVDVPPDAQTVIDHAKEAIGRAQSLEGLTVQSDGSYVHEKTGYKIVNEGEKYAIHQDGLDLGAYEGIGSLRNLLNGIVETELATQNLKGVKENPYKVDGAKIKFTESGFLWNSDKDVLDTTNKSYKGQETILVTILNGRYNQKKGVQPVAPQPVPSTEVGSA